VGTLCLVDNRPRQFGSAERLLLTDMGAIAERELLEARG
jgi:hypothetical protein